MTPHHPACLCPACSAARAAAHRCPAPVGPLPCPPLAPPGTAREATARRNEPAPLPMRRVCAWCSPRHVIEGPPFEEEAEETHGMCGAALAREKMRIAVERRERELRRAGGAA